MRDSFIFYKSFYEAIKDLPRDVQGEIYTAIMEYSLYGVETENLKPIARSIFILIKPQIDVNNQRFENGCRGGRPPKSKTNEEPNDNQTQTKAEPNDNVNVNDNEITTSTIVEDSMCDNIDFNLLQDNNAHTRKKSKSAPKVTTTMSWRNDYQTYLSELRAEYKSLLKDSDWLSQQQKFLPDVNITLTLEKVCVNYWATEAGWKHKKRKREGDIDWKQTLTNSLSQPQNKVYEKRINSANEREAQKREGRDSLANKAIKLLSDIAGSQD